MAIRILPTLLIILTSIHANSSSQLAIAASIGTSSFSGDLSNENSATNYEIQFHTLFLKSKRLPIEAYLSIEAMFMRAELKSINGFPFNTTETAKINTFLFAPTVCNTGTLQICFGLGQGTVNVNQEKTQRDYGTWNYRLLLKYALNKKIKAFSQIKYIGKVEVVNGSTEGHFSIFPISAGLSYKF